VSANLLYGFGHIILQNTFRRDATRRRDLPEHFGRLEEERRGNGEAQRLGGLEVDDQLKRGRLFHRQVRGLGPREETVHVTNMARTDSVG
jgi:hypothetical protein